MHLQPSEALRSDSLFEPYTLIYSLWTLESLTGMCLPFGVHPHSTSKQPLSISRVQTAAPSSAPDPTPRLQTRASRSLLLPSRMRWGRAGEGGALP